MPAALIVGATSAIASCCARLLARCGYRLYLLARDAEKLSRLVADLKKSGADVAGFALFEATDHHGMLVAIDTAFAALGNVDCTLLAHGHLPHQRACEVDQNDVGMLLDVNGSSVVLALLRIASHLERQGRGTVAAITSVAAVRGRRSNYLYGAAKAMVAACLAGLQARFGGTPIRVLDIRPGLVRTPMTQGHHAPASLLWTDPSTVAKYVVPRLCRGPGGVLYAPPYWRVIALAVLALPAPLLTRLKL